MTNKDYIKIYKLLDSVSPVPFDCGTICGAACCRMTEEEMGIYLLPGEEKIRDKKEWASYENTDGCVFVKCRGPEFCDRSTRPIQCRTFPLFPTENSDGEFEMTMNQMELPYSCPLIESEAELSLDFINTTNQAWQELLKSPDVLAFVKTLS